MAIEIREIGDLGEVWGDFSTLFHELYEYHQPLTGQAFPDDWQKRIRSFLGALLKSGQGRLWLAYDSQRAVGFMNAMIRDNPGFFQERVGQIDNAYVRSEYRGQRVASALLAKAEEWLREQGAEIAQLNVITANEHGQRVWEHLGYQPFSETRRKQL